MAGSAFDLFAGFQRDRFSKHSKRSSNEIAMACAGSWAGRDPLLCVFGKKKVQKSRAIKVIFVPKNKYILVKGGFLEFSGNLPQKGKRSSPPY